MSEIKDDDVMHKILMKLTTKGINQLAMVVPLSKNDTGINIQTLEYSQNEISMWIKLFIWLKL